jgi:hypothetical protein
MLSYIFSVNYKPIYNTMIGFPGINVGGCEASLLAKVVNSPRDLMII